MAYEVHIEVFDGPFDLLLQLIAAQQVDLYEVRLSEVVDAFCAEITRAAELDLDLATEFLLIAATLVELKCRRLLPDSEEVEIDEELSIFEARDYLLARLVECKMFREASQALHQLEELAQLSHARRAGPDERFSELEPDLLASVTPLRLGELAARALSARPVEHVDSSHVHVDEVTVAEMIGELVAELPRLGRTTLASITLGASATRIVACFLALLELYKQERVELEQASSFAELSVTWRGASDQDGAGVAFSAGVDDYDQRDHFEQSPRSEGAGEHAIDAVAPAHETRHLDEARAAELGQADARVLG